MAARLIALRSSLVGARDASATTTESVERGTRATTRITTAFLTLLPMTKMTETFRSLNMTSLPN